ncbi:ADP-ribosyltransferase exoenzyme [Legionella adelaidensis]|uniref:ADP-ribosyltransferase exoenzyme n=1 Tax=Legionella adelaidensis TaxID=45056 RepID=A0A0W0R2E0_9GAMM|nr:ADP-ribosyltransferase [Legionella adelaidensis]KTC65263.1 ADP-ribosyltransferase exoenzyme [Legionella adelaidensis]
MDIKTILDNLKSQPAYPLTPEIKANLKKLKSLCDSQYSNQSFYGNAALNRQMLLNKEVATLLTPAVILYLFTNTPTAETKIVRNSTPGGIALRDAIYYGFADGVETIKYITNNEKKYGPEAYTIQKRNFEENTLAIVRAIKEAGNVEQLDKEEDLFGCSLSEKFKVIINTIDYLKQKNKSKALLHVPGYSPEDMRKQVKWGFSSLCQIIRADLRTESLDSLCENFLQSPEATLDGTVIHLFYDRAHIEAALEQDTQITMGGKNYTFREIFGKMIEKITTHPEKYPASTIEQFYLRFGLVEKDLKNRFSDYVRAEPSESALPSEKPRIQEAFEQGNAGGVIEAFKEVTLQVPSYWPEFGPLPKSSLTYQFEELTRKLLAKEEFRRVEENGSQLLQFRDGRIFNLTEIVTHANLSHLQFGVSDEEQYVDYCHSTSNIKPWTPTGDFPSRSYFDQQEKAYVAQHNLEKDTELYPELSYADKLAINVYTTNTYKQINQLLRGQYPYKKIPDTWLRDTIIHTAFSGRALGKQSNVVVPGVFRYESEFNDNIKKRVALCETGEAEVVKGFISTGIKPAEKFTNKVAIFYSNMPGQLIGPLSAYPWEDEYLIPPAQIKYTNYRVENGVHYFEATPILDLSSIDKKAKTLPSPEEENKYKCAELMAHFKTFRRMLEKNCSTTELAKYKEEISAIESEISIQEKLVETMHSQAQFSTQLAKIWDRLSDLMQALHIEEGEMLQKEFEKKAHEEKQQAFMSAQYEHIHIAARCDDLIHQLTSFPLDNFKLEEEDLKKAKEEIKNAGPNNVEYLRSLEIELKQKFEVVKQTITKNIQELLSKLQIAQAKYQLQDDASEQIIPSEDNLEVLSNKKRELQEKLDNLNTHVKLRENCCSVLKEIKTHQFGSKDKGMEDFIRVYQEKIINLKGEIELKEVEVALKQTLHGLKEDAVSYEVKKIIESFRANAKWYTIGMNFKADRIEQAMANVPLLERANVHKGDSIAAKNVLKAMASHRLFYSRLLNGESLEETKAAKTYREFKSRFLSLEEDNPEQSASNKGPKDFSD